jgi:transposase
MIIKAVEYIQDNAKYNHAYAKTEHVKKLNITPLFLPAYCPNLNLIERIWKLMKKEVVQNTYYPTFDDFFQAIVGFCQNFDKHIDTVEGLMRQNFQILKAG